jgi:hypothetical protein
MADKYTYETKFQEQSTHLTSNIENGYYNNIIVDSRQLQRITFNFVLHTPLFLNELEGPKPLQRNFIKPRESRNKESYKTAGRGEQHL